MITSAQWINQVSNQKIISQTGLSSIGDIISYHRLGLFGYVARLDSGVPALECV